MSWHFSQALEGAFLEESSLDGEQFVLSKSILIVSPNLSKDKMTKYSHLSRSGMTFALLTERIGEELLTWYQEDFLVKESRSQAREKDLKTNVPGYGRKCSESFAKFDHVTHSWKIPHFLPGVESTEFSGTWPRWGIMQSGECWELMMSELTILGNEFGFFPTPVASSGSGNRSLGSLKFRPSLTEMARKNMWPTPTSSMQSEVDFVQARYPIKDRPVYSEVNGGPLNPMWVEWLMGWPLGWTDLEPLETAKFQWWLKSHGIS
ncbi:hypothetical protein LEP1GSC111_0081 [Leptospira interrogans str. UT126]|nr:hypothetical protein LEP1GSC087_0402 [Leptospira interrogans serovar Bataviae str. L1111]EMJ53901.1 hypothetical protein LEP1GSC111_0081 [Leptospira interrogans str. UT126]